MAGGIDRRAAHQMLAARDGEAEFCLSGLQNADGLGHDFGSDAVSGENRDAVLA